MPEDGVATVALYSSTDQLVRILAQAVQLPKGVYTAHWDGMDLWGHPQPVGSTLTCKLIHGPGIRAFYEFDLARGDTEPEHPGWLTQPVGEGMSMRTGGWLGDHTGPGAAADVGDRVFFGSRTVEHGHPIIACDLEGRKLWGGRVAGWDGPEQLLAVDGQILARIRSAVWRIDPETYAATRLFDTGKRSIVTMGSGAGKIVLLLRNPEAAVSPFRWGVRHEDIAFLQALPMMHGDGAPDYQLSESRRFSSVFASDGGHFQTGISAVTKHGVGHVLVPFASPKVVRTLVVGRPKDTETLEVLRLRPGIAYDPAKHSPLRTADGADDLDLDLADLDPNWEVVARTAFPQSVVVLPLTGSDPTTALQLRLLPPPGARDPRPWLGLCRLLDASVEADAVLPRIVPPGAATTVSPAPGGWSFRTPSPITEEAPASILVDYGKVATYDGLFFLNNTSTRATVEAYEGPGEPTPDDAAGWRVVGEIKVGASGSDGHPSASTLNRSTFVAFADTVTTRAFRLKVTGAYGGGRVALEKKPDDPQRVDCGLMLPLRLLDAHDRPKPQIVEVRNTRDGAVVSEQLGNYGDLRLLAVADDGAVYSVRGDSLARTEFSDGSATHRDLNKESLLEPRSLVVANGELVVGEAGRVSFLDADGRLLRRLGGKPYERGPWDRNRIGPASAVAVDRNNKVWIAESSYAPKRISRFAMDGTCEKEFFGPPQYGGGGWLDPDLSSFYYRGMHFALDWERGASRLLNLNDRLYTEETPALDASSFGYTQIGRPVQVKGRRYVVGDAGAQFGPGIVVCLLDGPVWKPCVVAGPAKGSPFLIRKEVWKSHWQKQRLEGQLFLWTDRNGDGGYSLDEVELFARDSVPGNPFDGGYWGTWMGPDLTLWSSSARLAPSGFSEHGVPNYERSRIQAVSYAKLAPFYAQSQSWGSRAAQGPSGTTIACADGSLSLCGQPYRVMPDGTLAGGPVTVTPSDYEPPVNGRRLHQVLHPAGSAVTASPVGEVVMHVGDGGIWSLTSVRDCVMLDQVFTGEDGGWSTDLPARRGIEVTRRKHDQETFFGHFTKANDGKYYAVAGKGFHALCRIEGLDAFHVSTVAVTIPADAIAPNAELRKRLVAQRQAAAARSKAEKRVSAAALDAFKPTLLVDGFVEEWKSLTPMDPPTETDGPPPTTHFGTAVDDQGVYLAYRGSSHVGNQCGDATYLFKSGFCADFKYRLDPRAKGGDVRQGDRRVVFGQVGKEWRAVLYDYVDPSAQAGERTSFESPVMVTDVARVIVLPASEVRVAFRLDELAVLGERERRHGPTAWGLEVFLPWKALGFASRPKELRADFGVMLPDSGGITVDRRLSWAEVGPLPVSDLAAEAQLKPGEWGTVSLP